MLFGAVLVIKIIMLCFETLNLILLKSPSQQLYAKSENK